MSSASRPPPDPLGPPCVYVPLLDGDDGDAGGVLSMPIGPLHAPSLEPAAAEAHDHVVLSPTHAASGSNVSDISLETTPSTQPLHAGPALDSGVLDSAPPPSALDTIVTRLTSTLPMIISDSHGAVTEGSKQVDHTAAISASRGGVVIATMQSGRNIWQPQWMGDSALPKGAPGSAHKSTTQLLDANSRPVLHEQHTMLHLHRMEHALQLAQHVQVVPHNLWEVLASDDC